MKNKTRSIKLWVKSPRNSCMISVVGYFFFGVMRAQEFTHRTAQTNINGDKQREVVRINASHIQFARNDLGSSVWSSLHQTQPSFTDYTLYIWSAHYARSARGLFDRQKGSVVRGCFSAVRGCFCWPFSLFVTFLMFVTFISYFLLLKQG